MSDLPRVKVVNLNDDRIGTECYINEKKIECVKAVDFRVAVDEVPIFTIETMGAPDIDMSGNVQFSFTPQTIEKARKIIEHETKNKHRVDLELHYNGISPYIDGERVSYCDSVNRNVDRGENINSMEFVPNKNALLLYSDDIQVDLSQYVRFAMIVLRNELLKHGDLYDGFLASMRSAIDDKFWDSRNYNGYMCDIGDEDFDEAAELMLKRIIGEE